MSHYITKKLNEQELHIKSRYNECLKHFMELEKAVQSQNVPQKFKKRFAKNLNESMKHLYNSVADFTNHIEQTLNEYFETKNN